MAKLKKCKTCGKEIANSAQTCPHCGAKLRTGLVEGVVAVILIIIVLYVLWYGI